MRTSDMRTSAIRITLCLATSAMLVVLIGQRASRAAGDITVACRGDYFRLCAGVIPGEGRVALCLRKRRAELSPACGPALDAAFGCRPEIEAFCRAATAPADLRACLRRNADRLGPECRAGLGAF